MVRKFTLQCILLIGSITFYSCKKVEGIETEESQTTDIEIIEDSISNLLDVDSTTINLKSQLLTQEELDILPDTALIDISKLDTTFILDVKYATADNFTKQVLYPCKRCLLRKEVAIALVKVHESVKQQGYFIKLFDCYRPNSVQWKMWGVFPDRRYVANPAKGSVHNRGGAVDLSLTNSEKEEINMGSSYDFFGKESHFAYSSLPDSTIELRKFLRAELEKEGFGGITSEWWHFSYRKKNYLILDEPLCEE